MAAEGLNVRGLTGVDISLPVAGVGTRAYAFLIDWHIRVLLALAWLLLAWLALRMLGATTALVSGKAVWAGLVLVVPATALYLLYHPVLELVLQGRTPGKRKAGVRIVTVEGATPGAGALLMRNLFRLIDSLPVFYVLGLVCCLFTGRQVRIGDLAAGTVLVIDDSRVKSESLDRIGTLVQRASVEPRVATLIQDLLDRWPELEPVRRVELARSLLLKFGGSDPATLTEAQLRMQLQRLIGGA